MTLFYTIIFGEFYYGGTEREQYVAFRHGDGKIVALFNQN